MAKKPVMGVVLQLQISGVYSSVAQATELEESDRGGETFDGTSYDSPVDSNGVVWKENPSSGLADPGKASYTIFFDPSLAGHQALLVTETQPANWKIIFPASGGSAALFTSTAAKAGRQYKIGDGLKKSFDLTLSGLPTDI